MKCMLLAKSAILLDLHAVGHGLLILGGVVVALFALGASKSDLCTHIFTFLKITLSPKRRLKFQSEKNRPKLQPLSKNSMCRT